MIRSNDGNKLKTLKEISCFYNRFFSFEFVVTRRNEQAPAVFIKREYIFGF